MRGNKKRRKKERIFLQFPFFSFDFLLFWSILSHEMIQLSPVPTRIPTPPQARVGVQVVS